MIGHLIDALRPLAAPIALSLQLVGVSSALGQPSNPSAPDALETPRQHVSARLIASHDAITPGEPMLLGVFLDIEEGWHTYWDGKNDSGFPVSVNLHLPEGFKAEPMLWPAPEREVLPGEILDHVYTREVTLVIPITPPSSLEPGQRVRLSADLEWLVCDKDGCIPESAEVELELPVARAGEARRASREARLIKLAHARIPKPLTPETRGVELAWEVGALVVRADRASEILFYPKSECPDLIDPIRGALAHGERLTLSFKPDDDRGTVSGVIEVKLANQRYPRLYEIKIARPDTGG